MTRLSVIVALGASVALLAGCAPAPELPAALTQAEIKERIAEHNALWWESMFPGQRQPDVDPIEYVSPTVAVRKTEECMHNADIEGLLFGPDGSWIYLGDDPGGNEQVNRVYFICSLEYPIALDQAGLLSDEQLEWIYDYNKQRLVPCLQLLGYTVPNRTTDFAPGTNDYWIPYYDIYPQPSADEWARIDLRCPPSPVGPLYRPSNG